MGTTMDTPMARALASKADVCARSQVPELESWSGVGGWILEFNRLPWGILSTIIHSLARASNQEAGSKQFTLHQAPCWGLVGGGAEGAHPLLPWGAPGEGRGSRG